MKQKTNKPKKQMTIEEGAFWAVTVILASCCVSGILLFKVAEFFLNK